MQAFPVPSSLASICLGANYFACENEIEHNLHDAKLEFPVAQHPGLPAVLAGIIFLGAETKVLEVFE